MNSQHGEAWGPAKPDEPTLYEFLTRLVTSPDARAAFDADPRAMLDQAGLGGMSATDVLQASSLVMDYAPIEVVEEYDRSLQSSVEKFAASTQFAAFNHLHSAHPHEQEVTELSMLESTPQPAPDFSNSGDVDAQLLPAPAPTEPTAGDVNVIEESGNLINISADDNAVGNVTAVGNNVASAVDNSVESSTESVTGVVSEVTGTVEHTVDTGAGLVAGTGMEAKDLVGDVTGGLGEAVGGVTGGLPLPGEGGLPLPELPVPEVPELPIPELPIPGDGLTDLPVVDQLPVEDALGALPAPSDLPVVGGPVGAPVEEITGQLPLDDVL